MIPTVSSRWFRKHLLWSMPLSLALVSPVLGQDGPPARGRGGQVVQPPYDNVSPGYFAAPRPQRMRDTSWIYIDSLAPRRVRVHDIVTVVVNEASEMQQDSRYNRTRNGIMKAELKEFVRIGATGNLRPAALDAPTIDAQLRSQLNTQGNATSREALRYRIAATVVDVLPNGTLVLEARKSIQTNGDLWEYKLTGRIRTEDILSNNTILSESIADLNISKIEHGKVYDSTKRGFVTRIYDLLLPF